MQLTALGLRKPENNDGFGQDDFNTNSDLIDTLLRAAGLATSGLVPACRVTHSVAQSLASGAATVLAFDTVRIDNDAIHDPAVNNSRLTCKTAGDYLIFGTILWAVSAVGARYLFLRLNGATLLDDDELDSAGATANPSLRVGTVWRLAVNDYVELVAQQGSGGALSVLKNNAFTPEFGMVRLG